MNWDIERCIIFETVFGSQVYGVSTSESDEDYRGVCIPPWQIRDSLLINFEQKDKWEGEYKDRVIYNIKKFFQLCKEANPAIIEFLFIPSKFWVKSKKIWDDVLEIRHLFISKKVKHTFTGYAHAQLRRIKMHRNWLLNPPKEHPTREGFGLPANPKLSSEQMSAILTIPKDVILSEYKEEARKEKHYYEAKRYWDMYENWKKNRNPDRAKLEEKYGYDTKHAMHLVRLMYEGEEILLTGNITFPRPEKEELLAIRNGIYSYEQLMEKVEHFDVRFEELYEKSILPHIPNVVKINEKYLEIIQFYDASNSCRDCLRPANFLEGGRR